MLLVFVSGSALNALEYHFPNNEVNYDRSSNLLHIYFGKQASGYETIKKLLEQFPELPSKYSEFLDDLKDPSYIERSFNAQSAYALFEGGNVRWGGTELEITESKFKRALRALAINEERSFYEVKLSNHLFSPHGIIRVYHEPPATIELEEMPEPKNLIMNCKHTDQHNASCWFVDKEGKQIKDIVCRWNISYPADLETQIKQELQKIKQDKIKKDKEWDKTWEAMKKECPSLYRTLKMAQQGYYVDPVYGAKAAQRFEKLNCGSYLERLQ